MELLVVVGPTASGKTELCLKLGAQRPIEVISADSVQLYRHFDIGTGKPSPDECAEVRHHLVDCIDPLEPMDAARWAKLADEAIAEIEGRGKVPVVCGGSFLYVKALLFGLAAAPPADEAVRRRHEQRAESEGREALHADLARVDPVSAARLNPNDRVRVSRALEVYELTGIPLSQWQIDHGFGTPRYSARLVGIGWSREQLDQRIRVRAEVMMAAGWIGEVEQLLEAGYANARAMQSVGYRQIAEALAEGSAHDSATLLEQIIRATRVFARRQRTWLRDQAVHWVAPDRMAAVCWEDLQAEVGPE